MANRVVRFLDSFFDDLDRQLPAVRGIDGAPASSDFLVYDLQPIRDALADDFEGATAIVPGAGSLRVFLGSGSLVRAVAVYARLTADGNVEVVGVELDVGPGDGFDGG